MYLTLAIFAYILGSIVMSAQLSNVWREKGEDFETNSVVSIHVLSTLWPLTIILGFIVALYVNIRRPKGPSDQS